MLRKLSIVLSAVAALGFALATSAPASAQQVHKNAHVNKSVNVHRNVNVNRNVHVNRNVNVNRNVHVNRSVHVNRNYVVGRHYNGHIWYGRNRHFWHGAWYAYGVGPCWVNVDGEWFWNPLACP
ncbi:MAG TPA: hypothetical protein VIE87_14765 [Pseudolabrys sp.]|jgi:hypothetical protein